MKVLLKYILKRTAYAILTLFLLSILAFAIARALPGNPARMALGPSASKEAVEHLRHKLNLDEPLHVQYALWLKKVLYGDLGVSLYTHRNVMHDIIMYMPATLEVIILAAIFEIVGATTIGVVAGSFPNKIPDYLARLFAYLSIAIPRFGAAIILQQLFSWVLPILPTSGRLADYIAPPPRITGFYTIDGLLAGRPAVAINSFRHMLLPAIALSMGAIGQDGRILRQEMVRNVDKDWSALHRSFGLPTSTYRFKYLLKPSYIPALTVMGMDIGALLAGAYVTELVFNYPGFSRYAVNAMLRKDLNVIVAAVLATGIVYTIANLVVDVMVRKLDPRIRLGQ